MWLLYSILLGMGFILTLYRKYEQSKKIKKLQNQLKKYIDYEQAERQKTKEAKGEAGDNPG